MQLKIKYTPNRYYVWSWVSMTCLRQAYFPCFPQFIIMCPARCVFWASSFVATFSLMWIRYRLTGRAGSWLLLAWTPDIRLECP